MNTGSTKLPRLLVVVALGLGSACTVEDLSLEESDVYACVSNDDCLDGFECISGRCIKPKASIGCDDFDNDGVFRGPQCPLDAPIDCNDNAATTHPAYGVSPRIPAAPERCDGDDNDCDGVVDEDANVACPKLDGVCGAAQAAQVCVEGVLVPASCNDGCPGADCVYGPDYVIEERLAGDAINADGLDNDCNGQTDEGKPACVEGSQCGTVCFGSVPDAQCACKLGTWRCSGTPICLDSNGQETLLPSMRAEIPGNGIDDDCNGSVD